MKKTALLLANALTRLKDTAGRLTANALAHIHPLILACAVGALAGAAYGAFEAFISGSFTALILMPIVLGFLAVAGSLILGRRSTKD